MHIAVFSHYRLPVKGYGGTERVVVAMVRALAALGHRVTLVAAPGTRVREANGHGGADRDPHRRDRSISRPSCRRAWTCCTPSIPLKRSPSHPFVQTLEGNLRAGAPVPPNNIFVSRDHARRSGREVFVYNGLDPADFPVPVREAGLRPVPGTAAPRQGIRLGDRSGEAHGTPLAAGRRLASEPAAQHPIRGRGGRTPQGGAAGGGALPVDAGALAGAVRAHHDRGAVLGDSGARHPLGSAARSREPGGGRPVRYGGRADRRGCTRFTRAIPPPAARTRSSTSVTW